MTPVTQIQTLLKNKQHEKQKINKNFLSCCYSLLLPIIMTSISCILKLEIENCCKLDSSFVAINAFKKRNNKIKIKIFRKEFLLNRNRFRTCKIDKWVEICSSYSYLFSGWFMYKRF